MVKSFQRKVLFFAYDNLFQHKVDISLYIFVLNEYFMPIASHAYNLKDPPFICYGPLCTRH